MSDMANTEQLPLGELNARILDVQRQIRSFHVMYRMDDPNRTEVRAPYIQRIIAVRQPCYLIHDSAKGSAHEDWRTDVLRQRAYLTEHEFVNLYALNNIYFRHPWKGAEGLPGSLVKELLFISTGIWPLDGCRPPRPLGHEHMLKEVAMSRDFHLEPRLDEVAGVSCHVLRHRSGDDRIWIAASKGFSVLKREMYDQRGGNIVVRYTLGDHSEVLPGVWFPLSIRNEQFSVLSKSRSGKPVAHVDSTANLNMTSFNDINTDKFTFLPPVGALRVDHKQIEAAPLEWAPGGARHLDNIANWLASATPRSTVHPKESTFPPMRSAAIVAFVLVLACWACHQVKLLATKRARAAL